MSDSKINSGQVNIELGGEKVTLKPTLEAALAVNRQFGGIIEAMTRLQRVDMEAMGFIVAHGLGLGDKGVKDSVRHVYDTGVSDLVGPITDYLAMLSNGGRSLDDKPGNPPGAPG